MKKLLLILLCLPFIGFGQDYNKLKWYTDVEEAINISVQTEKPLFFFFTGSDWCGWCKRLAKEVFDKPEFTEWASNSVVLVELDFPRRTKLPEATQKKNKELAQMFGVRGYPTVWFVTPETTNGKVNFNKLGSQGYVAGGPKAWIEGANKILIKNDAKIITYNTTSKNTKAAKAMRKITQLMGRPVMIDLSVKGKIQTFVEKRVNEWQQKGEFEKTNDYLVRVNEKNRTVKIKEFQEAAMESLKLDFLNSIDFSNIELGDYDADNETFLLKDSKLGNLVISVPINEAKLFKNNFSYIQFTDQKFVIIDDKFVLSYLELSLSLQASSAPNIYTYNLSNTKDYAITDIDYEFSSIEIDDITSAKKTKSSNISTNKLKVGESSVNINIPTNKKVKNRFALVIGNEDYTSFQRTLSSEQNVDYAVNDASIFKKYCLKTLGVKEENMFFLTNATAGTMHQEIDLITKIINKVGRKAELIVYYAGHGYPDELTKVPYLIPVDVSASNLSTAIKLDDLYQKLANTNASKITIFLDACFTGGGRNSGLVASRGVKVKPKEGVLDGNIVVFSASSAEESSLPYHDEVHGLFTYFLLKKFQESEGNVTLGELSEYLDENVSIKSLRVNQKEQNPTVNTSSKVINDWRNWKF